MGNLIEDVAFTYGVKQEQLEKQLADIKRRYERIKSINFATKPEIKKKVFNPAINAAIKLQQRMKLLPSDAFWTESGDVISDLEDDLHHFLYLADIAKDQLPDKKNTRGLADNVLANRLALLLKGISKDGKVTNYKSKKTKKYAGNYVKFLERVLPYFGIDADESQAYAQRYKRNTSKV